MLMINYAESVKVQPVDRNYHKSNTKRQIHFEIFGNELSHCIIGLSQHIPYVIFTEIYTDG